MQHTLFSDGPIQYSMLGCLVEHHPRFVQNIDGGEAFTNQADKSDKADQWLTCLSGELEWRQDTIRLFGKSHLIPRLNAWYGDDGTDFSYSGIPLKPTSWTAVLSEIRAVLLTHTQIEFNSVLANLYRNGLDKMGWHSDDEPQMCKGSPIVSVSLGAARKMQFKSKDPSIRDRWEILLGHGDLLVMHPPTQKKLKHCIPTMRKVFESRVNLTFRRHI